MTKAQSDVPRFWLDAFALLTAGFLLLTYAVSRGMTVDFDTSLLLSLRSDANPNDPVANIIVSITTLYRDYEDDLLVLLERDDPLSNVQTTLAGPTPDYDNTLVVLDASVRQQQRGFSKPLLLGLADKDEFLHNGSVKGEDAAEALNNLFNPARGEDEMGNPVNSPHPFYFPRSVADETPATEEGRAALVEYLLSRTTL